MKAVVIAPGTAHSDELVDLEEPTQHGGKAVVETLAVGVCGTDSELVEGRYGEAPANESRLVIGHESLGRVVHGTDGLRAGQLVAAIVRRPDPVPCPNCAVDEWDMCLNGRYTERGIKGAHGFLAERYTEAAKFLVPVPDAVADVGVLVEPASVVAKGMEQVDRIQKRLRWEPKRAVVLGAGPVGLLAAAVARLRGFETVVYDRVNDGPKPDLARQLGAEYVHARDGLRRDLDGEEQIDLIFEATGYSPLAFEAMDVVGRNGIVCLCGVSSGTRTLEVSADSLELEMVLENKVVFGTVNANRRHFEAAVGDLNTSERRWPGWLAQLITRRVPIERYADAFARAETEVKVLIEVNS
ncbi:MAG: glucose 1-dehydrogenase [Actinomycetota bacterium]|nr:glucose 1-dehydrogenase [Actinomycetota bacterium]